MIFVSGVSYYSLITAFICFNIGLIILAILRRQNRFLIKNSISVLIILLLLSVIRLIIPLDLSNAYVIQSVRMLPFIKQCLNSTLYDQLTWGNALLMVWAAGIAYVLLKSLIIFYCEIKRLTKYVAIEDEQVERIRKENPFCHAKITVSPCIDMPKVTGVIRPHIYLPKLLLSDKEVRTILTHEIQHVKNGDILIKMIYIVLKAICWWNPIIHRLQNELEYLLELRCDAKITDSMNRLERISYLETILHVLRQTNGHSDRVQLSVANFANTSLDSFTHQRFELLLNDDPTKSAKKQFLCLIIPVFLLSYFVILQPAYFPSAEELSGQFTISNDNSYIAVYEDGTMELYVEDQFYDTVSVEDIKTEPYQSLKRITKGERVDERKDDF